MSDDADGEIQAEAFQDGDHKTAYIFNPLEDTESAEHRPSKRRRVSAKKGRKPVGDRPVESHFVPLLEGNESPECVQLREELFNKTWSIINLRIQHVLREANRHTLEEVCSFMQEAPTESDKIPAAFISTGRNIASQDLLFEQLADTLRGTTQDRFVLVRPAEAPNLKSTLRKIIKDAVASPAGDDDGLTVGQEGGRRYLEYDLDALYASTKAQGPLRVFVAFQDSEAFDGNLLSELIALFRSWRDRIQFAVLFGIATSVELFQTRLSKATAQHLYGDQFDVAQANSVLESVFKDAISSPDAALRIGPSLLRNYVDRQQDQVAGIHAFVSSLRYAYMCHFYANPLSILLAEDKDMVRKLLQPEHLEAIRTLDSFQARVEAALDTKDAQRARSLLEDDAYLVEDVINRLSAVRTEVPKLLWSLDLMASIARLGSFIEMYMTGLEEGVDLENNAVSVIDSIRKRTPDEAIALCHTLASRVGEAADLHGTKEKPFPDPVLAPELASIAGEIEALKARSKDNGTALRNRYQAQNKVLRATVVDQRVQLSQDSSVLTKEDQEFTALIDDHLIKALVTSLSCRSLDAGFLHEAYSYDLKMPYRDVFIPRPGAIVDRALSRPHDYLNCSCCDKANGAVASTFPATSILYHLYCEAGALINVSDLWTAFSAVVEDGSEDGERRALVQFYRALSELRNIGYVKQSKKKADHIAKLKWI